MRYLRVKNNERYQHYKDRNPPWIKFYHRTLGDYDLRQCPIPSRLCFLYCLLLASETENRIPYDLEYLSERMGFQVDESVLTPLIHGEFLLASGARRVLAHDATDSSLLFSALHSPNQDLKTSDRKSNSHATKTGNGSARGEPLPVDFTPSEEHAKLATARGLELNLELVHFKSKAEELGWVSGNWALKFRSWMIQEVKFRQARRSP